MCFIVEQNACIYFTYSSFPFVCYRPQRSWGKVIFSEACVNNSVHRGGVCGCSGGMRGFIQGVHGFIRGACVVLFGGVCMVLFGGACVVLFGGVCGFFSFSDTMRYGQWADGTHPTGMHSCLNSFFSKQKIPRISRESRETEPVSPLLIKVGLKRWSFVFNSSVSDTEYDQKEYFSLLTSPLYLQIEQSGKVSYFIDAQDKTVSNWMRYVNCARYGEEQNVQAFQYRKKIYYRTTKEIDRDEELLVYYGDKYAEDLGEWFLQNIMVDDTCWGRSRRRVGQ